MLVISNKKDLDYVKSKKVEHCIYSVEYLETKAAFTTNSCIFLYIKEPPMLFPDLSLKL